MSDSLIPNPQEDRLLDVPHRQGGSGAGPLIGIIIIVVLLAVGALYFWGAHLNAQPEQLPLIPAADYATTTAASTTTP